MKKVGFHSRIIEQDKTWMEKGMFRGPPLYFERNLSLQKYSCVSKHVHKFTADRDAH